ncbi:hypothetical protein [Nocardia sp. NPDC051463]|uniref:hypothetical protein n=1 Tax=Nocardia sp. NPDC051463 TaxID=3154845 RepID=UPI0034510457
MVWASPIAQQVGQPRKKTRPTGASSKLTGPVTGSNATELTKAPNPRAPRTK